MMASSWRWNLVVLQLAGVLVSFAWAQDLSQATGPRQIGGCSAGRSLAGVDVSERQSLGTFGVSNEAECMDFCLTDANCDAAAYYRGVCYTKAMEVVNENVLSAPEDLTLLWCEDARECCPSSLPGSCTFCPELGVTTCIDKPSCVGFERVDDSLCCKPPGPPTLDDASGPRQIGGCSAGRSLAGADVSERQSLASSGVSSEAECLDFCLADANCNAAAYYRGVCYTKEMEVVSENVVSAPADLTLLWCEDEGLPEECVSVGPTCEFPNCPVLDATSLCPPGCNIFAFPTANDDVVVRFPPGGSGSGNFLPAALSGNCRIIKAVCFRVACDPSEGGPPCGAQDCTSFLSDTVVMNDGSIYVSPPDVLTVSGDGVTLDIECEADGGPWCPFQAFAQVVS